MSFVCHAKVMQDLCQLCRCSKLMSCNFLGSWGRARGNWSKLSGLLAYLSWLAATGTSRIYPIDTFSQALQEPSIIFLGQFGKHPGSTLNTTSTRSHSEAQGHQRKGSEETPCHIRVTRSFVFFASASLMPLSFRMAHCLGADGTARSEQRIIINCQWSHVCR